jgi:hypothetical protein
MLIIKVDADLDQSLAGDVENVKMSAEALQVTNLIFLELIAVNHPGTLSLGLLVLDLFALALLRGFFFGCVQVLRGRVLQHQHQAFAVRRPGKILYVLNGLGEALCLTALPVKKPDLGLALVALGKKCKILAVRAPARMLG